MSNLEQALAAEAAVAQASAGRIENRRLGRAAVIVALLSAVFTFAVLSNLTPLSPEDMKDPLLWINLVILLVLAAIVGREIWLIRQARRRGRAAAATRRSTLAEG